MFLELLCNILLINISKIDKAVLYHEPHVSLCYNATKMSMIRTRCGSFGYAKYSEITIITFRSLISILMVLSHFVT